MYVVAIPFQTALGFSLKNKFERPCPNGACAEVVARKVATVRWAAAALVRSSKALGLCHCQIRRIRLYTIYRLWAAALSSLPSLASAATARHFMRLIINYRLHSGLVSRTAALES